MKILLIMFFGFIVLGCIAAIIETYKERKKILEEQFEKMLDKEEEEL